MRSRDVGRVNFATALKVGGSLQSRGPRGKKGGESQGRFSHFPVLYFLTTLTLFPPPPPIIDFFEKLIRTSWVRDLYDPAPSLGLVPNRVAETPYPVFFIPAVGIGAGIVGAVVLTPLLAGPALGAVGFSAAGPVAGKETILLTRWCRIIHSHSSPPHFCVTEC